MKAFDCTDIQALLSGLVDGELEQETRHEAERHLASCAECRKLVSETERLNDLIRIDTNIPKAEASLPDGFAAAVLSRTVYTEGLQFKGRRWMTWTGWMAAAAAVALALTIWMLDLQRRTAPQTNPVALVPESTLEPQVVATTYRTGGRSWTFDGNFSPDAFVLSSEIRDAVPEEVEAPNPESLVKLSEEPSISDDDSDTLYSTSIVLEMLAAVDNSSFADVDRIRQIVEYDELLERLAMTRMNLSAAKRPNVLAAESILHRIVRGPIDMNDIQLMRDTVAQLDLANSINTMSNLPVSKHSL